MSSFKGIEMQVLQHDIDSLRKINDMGSFSGIHDYFNVYERK